MTYSSKHFIAVPTRGSIRWETVTRLNEIRDSRPSLRPILYQSGNLSIALTRNKIVREFLKSDCDILIMVDDDIMPPPDMMDTFESIPDKYGMISIPHPVPYGGYVVLSAYNWVDGGHVTNLTNFRAGYNNCDAVATGCVGIRRDVLESLGPDPFRIAHSPDAPITSDDFLFCKDLQEAGYEIAAYMSLAGTICDHINISNLAALMLTINSEVR